MHAHHATSPQRMTLIGQWLAVIWCAWESRSLIHLYSLETLYDSYPGYFFFLWLSPFVFHWVQIAAGQKQPITNLPLTICGLLFALLGRVISFKFPGQIGLAMSLAGLLPPKRLVLLWMCCACCWIHPFKWFVLQTLGPLMVTPVRSAFAIVSLLLFRLRTPKHARELNG